MKIVFTETELKNAIICMGENDGEYGLNYKENENEYDRGIDNYPYRGPSGFLNYLFDFINDYGDYYNLDDFESVLNISNDKIYISQSSKEILIEEYMKENFKNLLEIYEKEYKKSLKKEEE